MCENGGKRPVTEVSVGFTKEQADTIRRIRNSKDSWDMLGVKPGATRWARVQGLGSGGQRSVLGSGVGSQGLIIVVYIRCCGGLFSGRKWTKRTGSWPCCCTLTNASPLAAKMPSRLWWTLAPHCWRTLNSTKPQAVACSHTGPRWTLPGYYLFIQHSVFMPRCSMPTHRPVSWIKVLYLVIKTIYMT